VDPVQCSQDIFRLQERRGTGLNQAIGAAAGRAVDVPRFSKNLTPLVGGKVGSNRHSAAFARLDNHHSQRQAGNDAFARREIGRFRAGAHWIVGYHSPAFSDLPRQPGVLRRIEMVKAGAQDGNGATSGGQGCPVGPAIDASRHARYNGHTTASQTGCNIAGDRPAIGSRPPHSDDRHAESILRAQFSPAIKHRRRGRNFQQPFRIIILRPGYDRISRRFDPPQLGFRIKLAASGQQCLEDRDR
jgi:hypothetical protein